MSPNTKEKIALTPGPWQWKVGNDGWDGETCYLVGANDELVLSGWGYDASGLSFHQAPENMPTRDEPTLPDARLIAAAPELLAALHEVAHHADDECGFMVMVKAAIAKAEGWDAD